MPREPNSFVLTPAILAAHAGTLGIVCLDPMAEGRRFRLYAERPGPAFNRRAATRSDGAVEWLPARADLPSGVATEIREVEALDAPALIRVDISGPLEQFAGYYGECSSFSDGHDAICERLCAAFELGDVLLVVNSPGGAAAGLQQHVERAAAAKLRHGRRVTVYADEMICSAAMWWALGIGDEIYGPAAAQIGSIGARGAHASIAGALAAEGVVFTYFTWPNAGKVALAPEFPLTDEGRQRGERDIAIMGEQFCAACVGSAIGQRYGLTREAVMALSADVFTGPNAMTCPDMEGAPRARLIDGIATMEEVTSYALALAEGGAGEGPMPLPEDEETMKPGAADPAEEPAPDSEPAPPAEEAKPAADKMECGSCHAAMPEHARYCSACGVPVVGEKAAEGEPVEAEAPPSSRPFPPHLDDDGDDEGEEKSAARAAAPAARLTPPKALPASASLASILGATGTSDLALKTAAVRMRQVCDTAAGVTGESSPDAIVGALLTLPGKLDKGRKVGADLAARVKAEEDRERRALCHRLVVASPSLRSHVFADVRDPETGKRTAAEPRIRSAYASTPLATLKAQAEALEADAPQRAPARRDPFQPSQAAAAALAAKASGTAAPTFTGDDIARLTAHPAVVQMQSRGSSFTAAQLAESLTKTDPKGAAAWLAQNAGATK